MTELFKTITLNPPYKNTDDKKISIRPKIKQWEVIGSLKNEGPPPHLKGEG